MGTLDIRKVLVLGAGKVGATIADMVAEYLQIPVTLADRLPGAAAPHETLVRRTVLDVEDGAALDAALACHDAVINALPFFHAERVARVAQARGVHAFDLTEDVQATAAIRALAEKADSVLMPQCGLAPGVVGMLGGHLASRFDTLHTLQLRTGALARHATNALRYHFTWSIDGLINEYCHPCEAVVHGQRTWVQPLEGLESLVLDGEPFEAFHTSGGLGTLAETLAGRVQQLDYKTLRYPGHRDAMDLLLNGLRLAERRDLLRQVLEHAVPHSREDRVVLFAAATGLREGRLEQQTRLAQLDGGLLRGARRTAIELATAAGAVGALTLLRDGLLPARGFVRQEQIVLADFLATRAGHHYASLGERTEPMAGARPSARRASTAAHTRLPPARQHRPRKETQP